MKLRTVFCAALACPLTLIASQGQSGPASTGADSDIPHLRKQGTATQLIVDGKPFLVLAGELSNSSATGVNYMERVWPRIVAQSKLNTVLPGVSWNQIEPQEGKFDFTVLDSVIQGARKHNLRLVLIWFGSWKNSLSSYMPDWVKRDSQRFPRAQFEGGVSIEELSTLSAANRDADAKAFAALMRHVKQIDGGKHTVIMIQVENEVGMHTVIRDHSPAADQALAGPAPKALMDYLQQHKDTLIPEFRQVWATNGFKTAGTWEEVFGKGDGKDGIFMAWNYACYIGRVAEAGKAEYNIPMYVNAALYSPGRVPEFTPSHGRPWDLVMDIWRAGAPQIDILSPDIYGGDFKAFCAKYTQSGNPLFIPETRSDMESKMLYVFGRHDAIGLTLMGVERATTPDEQLITGCEMITQLAPLIVRHQGDGSMSAVMLGTNDPPQKVRVGNYTMQVTRMRPRSPAATLQPGYSAALFIAVGPDEYYAVGDNMSVTFSANTPGPEHVGLGTVEEGTFVKGRWIPSRQLAGDETGEGDNLSLRSHPTDRIPGDGYVGIQRFTLYRYP